jgi:hypothetical protein
MRFSQGLDYDPVAPKSNFTGFSTGPASTVNVTLPTGTRLKPGQKLRLDYYAVDLVFGGDTYLLRISSVKTAEISAVRVS